MKTEDYICDQCKQSCVTDTPMPAKYTFELTVIDTNNNTSGTTYLCAITPPITKALHFCSKPCIVQYVNEKFSR